MLFMLINCKMFFVVSCLSRAQLKAFLILKTFICTLAQITQFSRSPVPSLLIGTGAPPRPLSLIGRRGKGRGGGGEGEGGPCLSGLRRILSLPPLPLLLFPNRQGDSLIMPPGLLGGVEEKRGRASSCLPIYLPRWRRSEARIPPPPFPVVSSLPPSFPIGLSGPILKTRRRR